MLTYFLAGQPCPGPQQMDGLKLSKARNLTYWGFLYRQLGYVSGSSNLVFADPDSVSVLRTTLDEQKLKARTTFRIEQDGLVLYDGFIDYATYQDHTDSISVGLRDDQTISDLSAQATTPFSLAASESLPLHARRIGGLPGLLADPNTLLIQRSEASPVPITHSVPLTRRLEKDETVAGTLTPVVTPLASDRLYYNSTTIVQSVLLSGTVVVTPKASATVNATLRAMPTMPNDESQAVVVARTVASPTATKQTIAVYARIPVQPGQSLKLEWIGDTSVLNWQFLYDVTMKIVVGDEPTIPGSLAYGLSIQSVFKQVIDKATGGKLKLVSSFLKSDSDAQLFLANGEGIRGLQTTMAVSLQQLFIGLSKLFNLRMWVDDGFLRLEKKGKATNRRTRIDSINSRLEALALDYVFNSVNVGYSTWQAEDSALSGEDPNGQRTYSTGVTNQRSELDLVCDLICTSTIIEEQRRKQFDPQTASSSKALTLDANLFLICTANNRSETTQRTDTITNVYDPNTLYNIRLTPGRMLARHQTELAASLPLVAESVLGRDSMTSVYDGQLIDEADPFTTQKQARVPRLVQVTTSMSMADYAAIGDELEYPFQNKWLVGEILSVDWELSTTGDLVTINLLER